MNNDNLDGDRVSTSTEELDPVENVEPAAPVAEAKDGEVPPSGALPPDPTGLGALA